MIWHLTFLAFFVFSIIRFAVYLNNRPQRRPQLPQRPHQSRELADISGEIHGETERAYRFYDGKTMVWLPKSQCEWDDQSHVMTMPEWLALEKGLI